MTGFAFVCGVLPMSIAAGAGARSQQALGTGVMGGMIAVVVLALLLVPVFFVVVQRVLARDVERDRERNREPDREKAPEPAGERPPTTVLANGRHRVHI